MKVIDLTRKFAYNGITLPDPSSAMSPDEVRQLYAMQYPELTNAVVEGPVTKNMTSTYTFMRAVGSKGRVIEPKLVLREKLRVAAQINAKNSSDKPQHNKNAWVIQSVCKDLRGNRISPPSGAFGIFG